MCHKCKTKLKSPINHTQLCVSLAIKSFVSAFVCARHERKIPFIKSCQYRDSKVLFQFEVQSNQIANEILDGIHSHSSFISSRNNAAIIGLHVRSCIEHHTFSHWPTFPITQFSTEKWLNIKWKNETFEVFHFHLFANGKTHEVNFNLIHFHWIWSLL